MTRTLRDTSAYSAVLTSGIAGRAKRQQLQIYAENED